MKSMPLSFGVLILSLALLPACSFFKSEETKKILPYAFVDTLSKDFFDELHIKGAVSIPFALEDGEINPAYESLEDFKKEIEKQTGSTVDASTQLFFYCADEMCTSSKETADLATSWGLKGPKYASGLKGWYGLSLYSENPLVYAVEPAALNDHEFKLHSYLNSVRAEKPDEATLNAWQSDAQLLLDAMK